MPFRPKFNKYFSGLWEYSGNDSVGLRLTGYPTDVVKFLDVLQNESCNPVAARRILAELEIKGEKYTTLMANIDFDYVGDELKELSVTMEIVPPVEQAKINTQILDRAVLEMVEKKTQNSSLKLTTEDHLKLVSLLKEFKKSIEIIKYNFGPFDKDPKISQEAQERRRAKLK